MRALSPSISRKPRVDAQRNRARIVDAAHLAFGTQGLSVPTREIANTAEVGIATVSRHFPTRADLVVAVLDAHVARCVQSSRHASGNADPAAGIRQLFEHFARLQIETPILNRVLLATPEWRARFQSERQLSFASLGDLVDRAHAERRLRPGVGQYEVRLGLLALMALGRLPASHASHGASRLVNVLLHGLLAEEI